LSSDITPAPVKSLYFGFHHHLHREPLGERRDGAAGVGEDEIDVGARRAEVREKIRLPMVRVVSVPYSI